MLAPGDLGGIGFRVETDLLTVDEHTVLPELDVVGEAEVRRIVSQEVLQIFGVHHGVVDHTDVDSAGDLKGGTEDESANTAETINT
jgi:hypothetical protein